MKQPENFHWVVEGKLAVAGRPESVSTFMRAGGFVAIGDFTPSLQRQLRQKQIPFISFQDLAQRIENPNALVNIDPVISAIDHEIKNGRRVMVCCRFGYTLSPTIAIMYLTKKARLSLFDALNAVKPLNNKPLNELHRTEITKRYFAYGDALHENQRLLLHSHTQIQETPPVVYSPLVRKSPPKQRPQRKTPPKTTRKLRRPGRG